MLSAEIRAELHSLSVPAEGIRLMEVCGTHTMSIAKAGIKRMLPNGVELLSGPGCPVCVTDQRTIDAFLNLASQKNVIIATYGDMLRVPGSKSGDNLSRRRALGAQVETVYSPMDALDIAEANPQKEVVFLGIGFETTAPGTAVSILEAHNRNIKNYSVLSMLKTVEPALRVLCLEPDFNVDGFICPGHVASIIGSDGFKFLPQDFSLPAVVAGFEPEDILRAVLRLIRQVSSGEFRLENEYRRSVRPEGNKTALLLMRKTLQPRDDIWRGLGVIPGSGLGIREEYSDFDAEKKFQLEYPNSVPERGCCCGEIMKGKLQPFLCPLFGKACTPENPVGPCMVSSEGACAAAFKYRGVNL